MADTRFFTAIKPTTLSSGTAIGATSITPAFIKDREDNSIATMATYFGTKAFGVIGPNTSREEHFSFTGISAGVLTGVSHVSMVAPYTETSGLSEAHAAGEVVIIQTNSPAFYNELANKQNDETVTGTWTFTETALPRSSASHTYGAGEEEYFATKRYVDSVVTGGAADANTTTKGLAEEATQAEIAAGTAVGGTSARLFTNPSTLAAHIQSGAWLFGSTAGTADAVTLTLTPTLTAYTHGMVICIHNTTAINAAATINVDGLGAKAIYKYAGGSAVAVEANDMKALYHHILVYDSDAGVFLLVNPVNGTLTAAAQTEVQNFFSATDITGAEAETLSGGTSSNADTLHTHSFTELRSREQVTYILTPVDLHDTTAITYTAAGVSTRTQLASGENFIQTGGSSGNGYAGESSNAVFLSSNPFSTNHFLEFAAKYGSNTSQDVFCGIGDGAVTGGDVAADATLTSRHIGFFIQDGTLYASNADNTTQTRTDISSGVTLTNYNVFKYVRGTSDIKFYVNNTLVATHTTNIPTGNTNAGFAVGITTRTGAARSMYIPRFIQLGIAR